MINDSLGFIYARMASFNFDNLVLKTTNGGIVGYSEINEVNNQLIIQPNPCLEKCEITLPIEFINENFITIKLCNILGKTVEQSIIQTNHNKINLDLIGKTSGAVSYTHLLLIKCSSGIQFRVSKSDSYRDAKFLNPQNAVRL